MKDSAIKPSMCDVFREPLAYFFVGRPAYKRDLDPDAAEWELPVCFVFEYDISGAKRIYPFDTGAFAKTRYPQFLQMMALDKFEVTGLDRAPDRIIGAFFGGTRNYFRLKTESEESFRAKFALGAFDAEVKAYHKLILAKQSRADDRRTTIEVQLDKSTLITAANLLAVILPEPYFLNAEVRAYFRSKRRLV